MSSNGIQSVISDSNVVTNHPTMGEPFGKALIELAKENDKIVGLSADLAKYTDIHVFRDEFPDRFYNVGMSEQLMMCAASGLAKEGFIPFATTYSTFIARRCYDFISQAICEHHTNVKIIGGLPGLQSGYGPSHQATDDLAILGAMPNLTIIDPCDAVEMMQATKAVAEFEGPVYMRLLRGNRVPIVLDQYDYHFEIGKAKLLRDGDDALVISCGEMTMRALDAAEELEKEGIHVAVLHLAYTLYYGWKMKLPQQPKTTMKEKLYILKDSIWALFMPIIVLGLIFGGICTVSEAAAISAFYSAIVGVFIYKTVSIKNLLNTLYETTISVAAIMILVGLSKASAYVVISSQLPQLFMKAMTSLVSSKFVVLLMINVIFLILGCLMEGNCIIVMMVPLMLNLVNSFGIDLIQFGILTCVNIYIGCITPPVGVSLLVGTKLGGTSMGGAFKACMPFFLISLVTLLLVSYVPAFSLWLPSLAS